MRLFRLWPLPTGPITPDLYAVKILTVNFFLLRHAHGWLAIDAGFSAPLIRRELTRLGIRANEVTDVLLTHTDLDHAQGLSVFTSAEVWLPAGEVDLIDHRRPRLFGVFYNDRIRRPYQVLQPNDVVKIAGFSVRCLATPGHTIGSMSYLVNGEWLFAGDAFKLIDGQVSALRGYINMDTQMMKRSIRGLANITGVTLALTGHTGLTRTFEHDIAAWRQR